MPSNTQPLLASFSTKPLLISADAADFFKASIEFVVGHEHAEAMTDAMAASVGTDDEDDDFWAEDDGMASLRPYTVVNGILQVPVQGTLLNRFPFQLGRWATGYDYIERAVARGMADPNVRGIALVIDSPGGEVAGCFELVDKLYDWRSEKPIQAFAADHAYSAAYAIASVGKQITVTRSGGTGSVGVVTAHFNFEKALDRMGVEVTFIHAGKHKVDGNSFQKLPDAVKDRIQARVDKIYGAFTATVARNRNMEEDVVRGTEALTYDADDSIDIGFADRIGALKDEMIAFTDEVAEAEDEQMTTQTNKTGASAAEDTVTKAEHDKAVETARTEGRAEGATAERERMTTILGSDEGKARPKAAMSAALKTDMTADQAKAFLADLPEEKAEAPKAEEAPQGTQTPQTPKAGATPFDAAMSNGNPNVGASAGEGDDDEDDATSASTSILADYRALSGTSKKKA